MAGINLTLTVDTSEGRRKFGLLVGAVKDLDPVLREFERFKRGRVQELFESGGHGQWPDPSARTEQRAWSSKIEAVGAASGKLHKKLVRELGRAKKSAARVEPGTTKTTKQGKVVDMRARAENTVARRYFVLKEYERQTAGGMLEANSFTADDRRLVKSVKGLSERHGRAEAATSGRPLGKLPQTIRSRVQGGVLTIDSMWDSPAPAALNAGGVVGRGAKLAEYRFLAWEPGDADYLAVLLRERCLLAWES